MLVLLPSIAYLHHKSKHQGSHKKSHKPGGEDEEEEQHENDYIEHLLQGEMFKQHSPDENENVERYKMASKEEYISSLYPGFMVGNKMEAGKSFGDIAIRNKITR